MAASYCQYSLRMMIKLMFGRINLKTQLSSHIEYPQLFDSSFGAAFVQTINVNDFYLKRKQ